MDYTENKWKGFVKLIKILCNFVLYDSIEAPQKIKNYFIVQIPEGFEETRPEVIKINENKVIVVINCYKK